MKKFYVLLLLALPVILEFCSNTKKIAAVKEPVKLTYAANVQPIMIANCTPCHFPPKGFKKAYDTYESVTADIDQILSRIQKNPGEEGFMPFKHQKLADSTIMVFVQWKKDGLLQK